MIRHVVFFAVKCAHAPKGVGEAVTQTQIESRAHVVEDRERGK